MIVLLFLNKKINMIVLKIFAIAMLTFLYIAFGGLFCPTVKKTWVAMLIIAFWPIYLGLLIISMPLIGIYCEAQEVTKRAKYEDDDNN